MNVIAKLKSKWNNMITPSPLDKLREDVERVQRRTHRMKEYCEPPIVHMASPKTIPNGIQLHHNRRDK